MPAKASTRYCKKGARGSAGRGRVSGEILRETSKKHQVNRGKGEL